MKRYDDKIKTQCKISNSAATKLSLKNPDKLTKFELKKHSREQSKDKVEEKTSTKPLEV